MIQYYFFQGSHSIEELLQKSDAIVPKERRKTTPVALKATAGLRLLPSNSSKQLLEEVITLTYQSIKIKGALHLTKNSSLHYGPAFFRISGISGKGDNHVIYTKHV